MAALLTAILLTLGVSFFCSLLEAFILSTTVPDIEAFKKRSPRLGAKLERFRNNIDMTSSAILTLNTVANTLGASVVGLLASRQYSAQPGMHFMLWLVPALLVVGILVFSEIVPKNVGVAYRRQLQPLLVYPIMIVSYAMWPVAVLARYTIRALMPEETPVEEERKQEEAILLLADKSAKEGALTPSERDMIANALSLDDVHISEIMTPRTVVTALEMNETVESIGRRYKVLPFARIPVYRDTMDDVVGIVRRRDIMQAGAEDRDHARVCDMMGAISVLPETASALDALQLFLRSHQQLALVVDEFGSTAGVVSMEDVIEHLLGREIYEDTDVAIDMRDLARRRARRWAESSGRSQASEAGKGREIRSNPDPGPAEGNPDSGKNA